MSLWQFQHASFAKFEVCNEVMDGSQAGMSLDSHRDWASGVDRNALQSVGFRSAKKVAPRLAASDRR